MSLPPRLIEFAFTTEDIKTLMKTVGKSLQVLQGHTT